MVLASYTWSGVSYTWFWPPTHGFWLSTFGFCSPIHGLWVPQPGLGGKGQRREGIRGVSPQSRSEAGAHRGAPQRITRYLARHGRQRATAGYEVAAFFKFIGKQFVFLEKG